MKTMFQALVVAAVCAFAFQPSLARQKQPVVPALPAAALSCRLVQPVPPPLLDEYKSILQDKNATVSLDWNPDEGLGSDWYILQSGERALLISVLSSADPRQPDSLLYIQALDDSKREEWYQKGRRTASLFTLSGQAGGYELAVKAEFVYTADGKAHLSSEFGAVFSNHLAMLIQEPGGYFSARFDKQGKLIEFRAGSDQGHQQPIHCP